ncbi:MAG: glycosyltransferase family 2 protein [Candidatus Fournierella pullistercoris]|uniref:Glycosyltransferase family 2 protein n=1 Tax=Candidatus Allofournierella pullistercoris TaxID=2838597 RepID=A0A948T254_9FIRM|nr:glycosyltransferase family 2 protein [Candidatus Fournierella pullistercoris]
MEKILSVSIAAYNVQNTLRQALDSFVAENVRHRVDVMIVDDGSKDDTAAIAKEYEEQYPGTFRLISKKNGGWGSTLNAGMKHAVGRYFKQLDGDDYYSLENLADFLDFLETTQADLVYTPFVTFTDVNGGILRVVGNYDHIPKRQLMQMRELEGFAPAMHTVTVRTEIVQKNPISITEHCFYTDVEFVLKCCNFCKTVEFFEYPVYYYRLARNGQSMSIQGVRKNYKDHLKMLFGLLEYEKEQVKDESVQEIFRNRLLGACDMQYTFFFALRATAKEKKEFRAFDAKLKAEYPWYYSRMTKVPMRILRATNFFGYRPIARLRMRKDKKLKREIFEGT